ncbi:hypothetical protein [Pedobacter miscanthi]|nr:hypothetical protein [Pedobacter miscanthi]
MSKYKMAITAKNIRNDITILQSSNRFALLIIWLSQRDAVTLHHI